MSKPLSGKQACGVYCCDYVKEGYIEDFPVCALHDARQTRLILEAGLLPVAGFSRGRPIVYRSAKVLELKHLDYKESREGIKAFEHHLILEVDYTSKCTLHSDCDLTVP